MQIIEIQIKEFGMLTDRRFSFAPGINILEGRNESGKSTLLAFIKFIFYGAPNRSAGETVSERTRRLNWQTGRAAGSLTLEAKGGQYRIERSLLRTVSGSAEASRESFTESLQIIDLASGSPLPRGTQPGEYFLGVPAAVFESTAYVRQLGSSALDGSSVSEALENLLTSASESSNTARALSRLDSARKALLHKNARGGEIYTLQTERTTVANRLARAKATGSDRIAAEGLLEGLKKSSAEAKQRLDALEQRCDASDALMLLRRFESLHALEKKVSDLNAALEALHAAEGNGNFFPNRAYASELRTLERQTAAAKTDLSRSQTELARMRYETPCDTARAEQAAEIRTAGGVDALTGRFAELMQSAKSMRSMAILLYVLGGLLLCGGAALFLLFHQPLVFLGKLGIGAAGIALPLLAGGIAAQRVSGQRRSAAISLCRHYGMTAEDAALDESALAAWLENCFGEEEQMKNYAEVLGKIEAEIAHRQASLDGLRQRAFDALGRWGISVVDGGLRDALSNAIPRAEHDADTADELQRDLDKYMSVWQNTAAELDGQDEALLRRRAGEIAGAAAEMNITGLRRERDFTAKQFEAIEHKRIDTEKQLIALEATAEDPIKLAAKLEEIDRRLSELNARHDAICLAISALTESSESMRREVIPRLRIRAGELLSAITAGRYAGVGVGRGMALTVEDTDATRAIELLSSGTVDAAYLALRLALLELLFPAERPPLLLDESLTQLDDERAAAALALLSEAARAGGQTLLFTCHPREACLIQGNKIEL